MNVFIARDGAEIGEYPHAQLEELARVGRLRPSDYYWYEGMETWLLLGDWLGDEAWQPKRKLTAKKTVVVARSIRPSASLREAVASSPAWFSGLQRPIVLVGSAILGFVLLVLLGSQLITSAHSSRPAVPPSLDFSKTTENPLADPNAVRDKAAAELRQRIDRLPDKPVPPRHTFYYGVTVNMRRSYADGTSWVAVVRGGENVVEPATQATTMHTDFLLTAVYRDGQWVFQHYRATVTDTVKDITTEIDDDEKAPAPPSLAGELGLRLRAE